MEQIGGKFTDMSVKEWVDYELERQERWIQEIAYLPWSEYVESQNQLAAHMAKAQVLNTVKKKLQESK